MRARRTAGFTLVELMIAVAIVGILASMAIPQFSNFIGKSRQSEAKTNLRNWYLAQVAYFSEKGTYAERVADSTFSPGAGNRYAYLFGAVCTYQIRDSTGVTTPLGANCISTDMNRLPGFPIAYTPAAITMAFAGAGPDPGTPGFVGSCPDCNIMAVATSNVDNEFVGVDTWIVSTKGGTLTPCGGTDPNLVPGIPAAAFDDVVCD